MEHFFMGFGMRTPTIFSELLITAGIIAVTAWAYSLLSHALKRRVPSRVVLRRREERTGRRD
jgi:hypothetical protein